MQLDRRKSQSGNNVLEFALVGMPLVALLLGVTTTGLALGKSVQVTQLTRDTASMYVRGVDFSVGTNQDLLVRLARGLDLTRTGGDGVIILSTVTWIPQARCTQLQLNPCNGNRHVITHRLVIGRSALRRSNLGTPNPALIDSKGVVSNYMTDQSATATMPMQLADNRYAYVVESHFTGFLGGTPVYSRAIF